jgi:hypothetical protein
MQSVNGNSVAKACQGLELFIDFLKSGKAVTVVPAKGRKAKQFRPMPVQKVTKRAA